VRNVSNVRQIEICTHDANHLQVAIAIAKLKNCKSPQIPTELLRAECETLLSANSLIQFGIKKSCLISGGSLSLYQFTERVIKQTVIMIAEYHCYHLHTTWMEATFTSDTSVDFQQLSQNYMPEDMSSPLESVWMRVLVFPSIVTLF
jgi:hypothetical protein